MTDQRRLTVEATAAHLGISQDAVRSRIKRGTLWALRRGGRVLVVLKNDPDYAPKNPPERPTNDATQQATNTLSVAVEYQRRRIVELQRERDRLADQNAQQQRLLEREQMLRQQMQGHIERLTDQLNHLLPEGAGDRSAGADQLWRRLERQVERLNEPGTERNG